MDVDANTLIDLIERLDALKEEGVFMFVGGPDPEQLLEQEGSGRVVMMRADQFCDQASSFGQPVIFAVAAAWAEGFLCGHRYRVMQENGANDDG